MPSPSALRSAGGKNGNYFRNSRKLCSEIWLEDDKRTSHLSHEPGGVALVIVFNDGRVLGYDKIKYPSSYAERAVSGAMGKKIENIYMSSYVETVFVRPESTLFFVQAWSKETDTPLKYALKQYDKEMPNNHQVDDGFVF